DPLALIAGAGVGNKTRIGKLSDFFAFEFADFGRAFLFHLIDADDRMHWYIGTLNAGKFVFQALFSRVNQQLAALAEYKLFNLNKTVHLALINRTGEEFVNLSLVQENDFVDGFNSHNTLFKGSLFKR